MFSIKNLLDFKLNLDISIHRKLQKDFPHIQIFQVHVDKKYLILLAFGIFLHRGHHTIYILFLKFQTTFLI